MIQPQELRTPLLDLWNSRVERCGFVLKDGTVVEVPNGWHEPEVGFGIWEDDLFSVMRKYGRDSIEAIFHTHPSNNPCPSDLDNQGWPSDQFRYFVVVKEGVYEWSREKVGEKEYVPVLQMVG